MEDNKNKYQMKRRRFGYGWTPVTWQSWVFIALQLVIIFAAITFLPQKPAQPTIGELVSFFAIVSSVIASLAIFSLKTGPKPKWRWGRKPSDNPSEIFSESKIPVISRYFCPCKDF